MIKKFEQYINENTELSYTNKLVNALNLYCINIIENWQKEMNKMENGDMFISRIDTPSNKNLYEVASNQTGQLIISIITDPPSDLDHLIQFLEHIKTYTPNKGKYNLQYNTDSIDIRVMIPYNTIDKNVLKSYMTINKFDL